MKGSRTHRPTSQHPAARPAQGGAPPRAALGNQVLQRHLRGATGAASRADATFTVATPHEASEREAAAAAAAFAARPGARPAFSSATASPAPPAAATTGAGPLGRAMGSSGAPLNKAVRADMEDHFGADLSQVRVHTGPTADRLASGLGARAFTHQSDIVFGAGYRPGSNTVTAHELAHVVQQTAPAGMANHQGLSPRAEPHLLQRDRGGSFMLPAGGLDVDLRALDGSAATPPTHSGMAATIGFTPSTNAPNSNVIAFSQIAKIVNLTGGDIDPATLPPDRAPRGPLNAPLTSGVPGVRTADDPARGVEGGFSIDVVHRNPSTGVTIPPGGALAPSYPTGPGPTAVVPGFKRSDNPADIRSTTMFDQPGTAGGPGANMDFSFESVVRGEDTGITYGSVGWGFGLRAGHVVGERLDQPTAGASATFGEAMERHRDFYVHDPVTFYFDFDSAVLTPAEDAKIGAFTAYLARNPDIHMDLEGFADIAGGNSDYNRELSLRRAEAVKTALLAHGIREEDVGTQVVLDAHVSGLTVGQGASTAATRNAGTGDQGGDPAIGGDQMREANRWANRRVVLTFRRATPANP